MIRTTEKGYKNGRGAQVHLDNPFENNVRSTDIDEIWYDEYGVDERTQVIMSEAKTIVNKVDSPDVGFDYSLNPYQGCEHGCVYCYARNTHNYWGYGAGMDFESKIIVKKNAPQLLEAKLRSRSWVATPIMLSGNTDCYQPVERRYKITRQLLEIFLKYKHPVQIVTKSALILRDLDLLTELNKHNLVSVAISVPTLHNELHKAMEPRTATPKKRMQVVKMLSDRGIPVTVLAAPIIPGLNDEGIFTLVKVAADHGARDVKHMVVTLNGEVAKVFKDWARKNFPYRWRKILRKVASLHNGHLGSSTFGARFKGSGQYASMIHQQFAMAKRTYALQADRLDLNTNLYDGTSSPQMCLF